MGTYVRYPCAHTTKKPLPTVGGFLERLVKRDANPAPAIAADTGSIPETEASIKKPRQGAGGRDHFRGVTKMASLAVFLFCHARYALFGSVVVC